MTFSTTDNLRRQTTFGVIAAALSDGRRQGARLVGGEKRSFGLTKSGTVVEVPWPVPSGWSDATTSCGIALQCAPSKDLLRARPAASGRVEAAVTVVEGGVALSWVSRRWPGLVADLAEDVGELPRYPEDLALEDMLREADLLVRAGAPAPHPILGRLSAPQVIARPRVTGRRVLGRLPWVSRETAAKRHMSVPVGGNGGAPTSTLPPPSRPEDDDTHNENDRRSGISYPEWNIWSNSFLPDHVTVLETVVPARDAGTDAGITSLDPWFRRRLHRTVVRGLDDGSDLDVDAYVRHVVDEVVGDPGEPRWFQELRPTLRDVTSAVLVDGSASLSSHEGAAFSFELRCADALSASMTRARERHAIFVFNGDTRHNVKVQRLKDFDDPRPVSLTSSGLTTGGYTRLGAAIRHATARLNAATGSRRVLLILGDGLMSDEGYEGHYAWADTAHAVTEAEEAGIVLYYIGVGVVRVDPLPEVFGRERSCRITRLDQLPDVLASVHAGLVAA